MYVPKYILQPLSSIVHLKTWMISQRILDSTTTCLVTVTPWFEYATSGLGIESAKTSVFVPLGLKGIAPSSSSRPAIDPSVECTDFKSSVSSSESNQFFTARLGLLRLAKSMWGRYGSTMLMFALPRVQVVPTFLRSLHVSEIFCIPDIRARNFWGEWS